MQTIESLKRKIQSAQDLLGVVKTMKALAAVSIRQYQKAVESLAEYNRTVEMGLQVVLKRSRGSFAPLRASAGKRLGVIVFGSDQGLCGQLNNLIAAHAIEGIRAQDVTKEHCIIIAVGVRVADILEDAGYRVLEVLSTPGSTGGITPMVQDITTLLEDWRFKRQIENMVLYYNEYLSGANYRPKTLKLLPVDREWLKNLEKRKWESRTIPTFTLDWETIFRALIREYLFVSLYRAFADSLASENASRLAAMQSAEKNIEERLEELFGQFHRQRQSTITEELLDIVSGFEALGGAEQEGLQPVKRGRPQAGRGQPIG
ncbi:MAG: F0F1 ATP synthase subunit gamma [Pseudomonadota bacterium]|jgi:F-type H+-transporting ATPase subunit gamma|nr:F0F1 ATP synthase subunit gamma [Pseudomonadota bacterium]NLX31218.1 F0F1 ATP synthase subunit gamma [Deltaproteobacteria bacterium]HNU84499.1 F0F1 ATP synthase subunit gamma [Syntrophales bacterium]HNZ34621.1 F0F1 ATP synthase subunit gamma [Syntrophales bacterium]HOF73953.1 F0F1 ATP synthase subunit gamma [Syntrophales bacterium]